MSEYSYFVTGQSWTNLYLSAISYEWEAIRVQTFVLVFQGISMAPS